MENKEEFENFLEEHGITDSINRVLVALYNLNERPENPLEYIKKHLGAPDGYNPDELRKSNEKLEEEINDLKLKIKSLRESKREDPANAK